MVGLAEVTVAASAVRVRGRRGRRGHSRGQSQSGDGRPHRVQQHMKHGTVSACYRVSFLYSRTVRPFLYLLLLGLFLWESGMWVGEREEEEEAPFFLKGEAEEAEVVVVEPSGNFSRVTSSFPYIYRWKCPFRVKKKKKGGKWK